MKDLEARRLRPTCPSALQRACRAPACTTKYYVTALCRARRSPKVSSTSTHYLHNGATTTPAALFWCTHGGLTSPTTSPVFPVMENTLTQHPWLGLTGALAILTFLAWAANTVTKRVGLVILRPGGGTTDHSG